jgi:redox-sensitive bicupin YhaK (pirin superfamily)
MTDGNFAQQDSDGSFYINTEGAAEWMTAGGGIWHIETQGSIQAYLRVEG